MRQEITAKKVLTIGGSILLFTVIIGYGIWISRDLLFGIQSKVSGITDGLSVTESLLTINGRARHANAVTLDGRIVSIDQKGIWTDTIALLPGDNIITIGASDKFGRKNTKSYHVYYHAPQEAVIPEIPTPPTEETTTATSTDTVQ